MSTLASVFGYGLLSARPAAAVAGRFYYATDTSFMYRDNGATWDTLAVGAGSMATDVIWAAAGDLAIGTGSHTAAKYALSVPAANLLNVLGVVNGETTPTWKALFAATAPSTQAFGDAAAAGTSVVAERQGHKHAMPAAPTGLLLAVARIVNAANYTTTSATQADIDSSVAITFTAPASGNILVRAVIAANMSNAVQNASLGLREGTTNLVNGTSGSFACQGNATFNNELQIAWEAYLTGVSAGSHTYKLAFSVNGGATFIVRSFVGAPIHLEVIGCP